MEQTEKQQLLLRMLDSTENVVFTPELEDLSVADKAYNTRILCVSTYTGKARDLIKFALLEEVFKEDVGITFEIEALKINNK